MRAHIIYPNYLAPDGKDMSIGGIQTYIANLAPVLRDEGYEVHIYQRSEQDFTVNRDDAIVHGCRHKDNFSYRLFLYLFDQARQGINPQDDLVVFGSEACVVPCPGYRSIAIQHGIWWDIARPGKCSGLKYLYHFLCKSRMAWCTIKRDALVGTLVCVDHNFVNWYRALTLYPKNKLYVIPNFSETPDTLPHKDEPPLRIIFARRFNTYRGTRLFTHAIMRILGECQGIEVTVAGTGPDEQYMRERLEKLPGVTFTTYASNDSLRIHSDKHIAVVPTTGSEGTSLSLLEAMASGCAVICTNVGGMTNIVLDHYNGIMISPDEEELYQALKELIGDAALRRTLAARAYDTVCHSFSLEIWKSKWRRIIREARRE